jgi:hypothetical protein
MLKLRVRLVRGARCSALLSGDPDRLEHENDEGAKILLLSLSDY